MYSKTNALGVKKAKSTHGLKKLLIPSLFLFALLAVEVQADNEISNKLRGKILLQVEQNGEAWYVDPSDEKRHFMGRPSDAFSLMRNLGIGITNANLEKIEIAHENLSGIDSDGDGLSDSIEDAIGTDKNKADTDDDGHNDKDELLAGHNPTKDGTININKAFAEKQAGKILLQIEKHGEAWYINPSDNKRYYLGRPSDAFNVMRKVGLGITNNNLEKIADSNTRSIGEVEKNLIAQSKMKKFIGADELAIYLKNNELNSSPQYSSLLPSMQKMSLNDGVSFSSDSISVTDESALGSGRSGASTDFSTTNIQVAEVDEADIIKTDGEYIYALVKKELFIIHAHPASEAEIVSKIKFTDRPLSIYINDDKLVVYGQDYSFQNKKFYNNFIRRNSFTFFKIFDISDHNNPKQIKDLNFEGNYSNSRMIGDYVYLVTNNHNYRYIADEPTLPRIMDETKALEITPDLYYFDTPYNSYNMTSINAINIKDLSAEIKGDVYLLDYGQNMYVSKNNIYLTYTKHINEYQLIMEVARELIYPKLSTETQERIKQIEETANFILSKNEKQNKISQIIQSYIMDKTESEQKKIQAELETATKKKYQDLSKEMEKTVIHKIAIDSEDINYLKHGEVTGHVLNQFSMDEASDGYFRIATTKGRTWSRFARESQVAYNNLYILDQDLNITGSVEDLAKDEQIKSVRFMQNKAYMVTFKQIDPLFVIDLADPKNPKVLGKLKIPGYSDYLHPYNDNMLIGLGKDAFENEHGGTVTGGVKLSLFDVSDFSNPREVDNYIMGDSGSNSIALHDHKAFYLEVDKNLLSIPVSIREKTGDKYYDTKLTFSGAIVFDIDENGFKLKGKIDHSGGGKTANSDYWRGYSYHDNNVQRILHISDILYTFSNQSLMMNNISSLEEVNSLDFVLDDIEIITKGIEIYPEISE